MLSHHQENHEAVAILRDAAQEAAPQDEVEI